MPDLHTLSNNAPLIINTAWPGAQTAAVGVYFTVGARHETPANNGISHFLEHMAFQGTTTRSALQIAQEAAQLGAEFNAGTGYDMTVYYMVGRKDHVNDFIALLADIVRNPAFAEEEFTKERGTILEEIRMLHDKAERAIFFQAMATAFPDQPLGSPISGPAINVETMLARDLAAFRDTHYTAGNLIVSVSGDVDAADVQQQVERHLGDIPAGEPSIMPASVYAGGVHHEQRPQLGQTQLSLMFKSYPQRDPRAPAATVLAAVLGSGAASRLYQEVRDKRGLVYTIQAGNQEFTDNGVLSIYAASSRMAEALPVIGAELRRIGETLITPDELTRVKEKILTQLAGSADSIRSRMEFAARSLIAWGRLRTPEEIIAIYEAVTVEDVQAAAREIFAGTPTFVTIGPGVDDAEMAALLTLSS